MLGEHFAGSVVGDHESGRIEVGNIPSLQKAAAALAAGGKGVGVGTVHSGRQHYCAKQQGKKGTHHHDLLYRTKNRDISVSYMS